MPGKGRNCSTENGRAAISSVCIDITAQREAQDEVLHLYNNIPGAVFRCRYDADFSAIDANDKFFEFTGYTREEFTAMGNRMSAVIDAANFAEILEKVRIQLEDHPHCRYDGQRLCGRRSEGRRRGDGRACIKAG